MTSSRVNVKLIPTDNLVRDGYLPDFLFFPDFVTTHFFLQHMVTIPQEWALYQTYLAGELVYEIFISKIHQRQTKHMDIGLLDIDTCIALEHLANVMATAYSNPSMHSSIHLSSGQLIC
jgi:hypothetical protein